MSALTVEEALDLLQGDVPRILAAPLNMIGVCNPPNVNGVYMFLVDGDIMYVGEAKGSKGLRDRILRKHVSGDDGHALQRAYKEAFPDRKLRREHIKKTVSVRWVEIEDDRHVSALEKLLIWLHQPAWNRG